MLIALYKNIFFPEAVRLLALFVIQRNFNTDFLSRGIKNMTQE